MRVIKGRKYILFGNFPDKEGVAKAFQDSLGVEVHAFVQTTDKTTIFEYVDNDEELEKLKRENLELKKKISKRFW